MKKFTQVLKATLLFASIPFMGNKQLNAQTIGILQASNRVTGGTTLTLALAIATDAAGNIYQTGYFNGTITFGSYSLTSAGNADIYVVKYSSTGAVQWAQRAGSTGTDVGLGIAVSGTSVYITGYIGGTADFNTPSNASSNTIAGVNANSDIFIAKYDDAGNFIWAKRAGGVNVDISRAIAVSGTSVYITGSISGSANFNTPTDPTSNAITSSASSNDIFIAKYDDAGNFKWAKRAGGTNQDIGYGIAVNSTSVYITGYISGTANFNTPTAKGSNEITGAGGTDIFIAKYDDAGNYQWAKRAGGISGDVGNGIALNGTSVYITGKMAGTANFNTPSDVNSNTITSFGNDDIFIAKYDDAGNYQWAKRAGGAGADVGNAIAANSTSVYITGSINSIANFNTPINATINTITSAGGLDIFVAKYDNAGNYQWAKRAGGTDDDGGYGITLNGTSAFINGFISTGTANFNTPSSSGSNVLTSSYRDAFLAEYKECTPTTGTFSITACSPYTWAAKGNKVYTANNNTDTIVLKNAVGCDSVVTLNLTIINSLPAIGGASSLCVGSTLQLSNAQAGGVWVSNNNRATVNASGLVTGASGGTASIKYALTTNGCNLSTTATFAVNNLPLAPSINYAAGTNISSVRSGANFCANRSFTLAGSPSGGAWSSSGVVNITGGGVVTTGVAAGAGSVSYTYTNENGCSSSRTIASNVVVCASRGSRQSLVNSQWSLYPNPSTGVFNIKVDKFKAGDKIVITDILGKQVYQQNINSQLLTLNSKLTKGMYLVSVITAGGKETRKVIVE